MSVQVSYKKQLALYLMIILVFLVVIEGVQRTYDFFTLSDCEFPHRELLPIWIFSQSKICAIVIFI